MKCRIVKMAAAMIAVLVFAGLGGAAEPVYGAEVKQNDKGRAAVQYLGDGSDGKGWENPHYNGVPQYKYKVNINGNTVYGYCFQPGRNFKSGYTYTAKKPGNASAWTNLKASRQRIARLIMFYGYNNGKSAPYGNSNDYYAATQALIWEAVDGDLTLSESGKWQKSSNWHDDLVKGRGNAEKCYDWIRKQISEHVKGPSFAAKTAASAKTYKMKYNYKNKKWSVVLKDTRAVNFYKRHGDTADSLKMSRSGNEYTFSTAKSGTKTAVMYNANSDGTSQPMMVLKPSDSGMQAILFGASDSTKFYAKLTTEKKGKATIIKKTSDGSSAAGFRFLIKNKANGYSRIHTTDTSGKIVLDLYPGTYTITEQLTSRQKAAGYVTPAGGKITVKEGGKSSITLTNKRIVTATEDTEDRDPEEPVLPENPQIPDEPEEPSVPHRLILTKTEVLEDGTPTGNPVAGAVYEIYSIEVIGGEEVELYEGEFTTDDEGRFTVKGLSPGRYYISETGTPDGYIPKEEPLEVLIKEGESETHVVDTNQREYGSVLIEKSNEHGYPLEDTVFGLYSDPGCGNLIGQYVTDDTGRVKISDIEWGTYYLKEDKASRGHVSDDDVYTVIIGRDGSTEAGFSIVNRQKKGSVELVKTDETGSIMLEGAEFDLYRNDGQLISAGHVTDGSGRLKVDGLDWNDYYFQEVRAPAGYSVDPSPVRFSVNATTAGITQEVRMENKAMRSDICIKKKIRASDIHYDHGVPVFTFNLKGTTVDGEAKEYNRQAAFSEELVKNNTGSDGYVTASVIFDGLKAGTYVCSEWETARYRLAEIAGVSENGSAGDSGSVTFCLEGGDHGEAVFINEKTDWRDYSDSTSLTNILKTGKRLTAILVEYVGPEDQEGNKPFVAVDNLEVTAFYDDGSENGLSHGEYTLTNADGTEFTKTEKQAGTYRVTVSYTEKGITKKGDFSFEVLPAEKMTVRFETNGGEPLEDICVWKYDTLGDHPETETVPAREGYLFDGWYADPELTEEFGFDRSVENDITLYAGWKEDAAADYALLLEDGTLMFAEMRASEIETGMYDGTPVKLAVRDIDKKVYSQNEIPWLDYCGDITSVKVAYIVSPKSTAYWFSNLYNCRNMDLTYLDTGGTDSMTGMFSGCCRLEQITVGSRFVWKEDGYLTAPSGIYVTGADDANWYNIDGDGFTPEKIPSSKADTYYAVKPEAYAVYCGEDKSFTFIRSTEPPSAGGMYDGKTITAVYTGFEEATYSNYLYVPWLNYKGDIREVIFVNKIKPVSTACWFAYAYDCSYVDASKLDMSRCITMGEMFYAMGESLENVTIKGMENWDTSSVQKMHKAFMRTASKSAVFDFSGIENWDTSSVTTVANMFRNMGLASAWTLDLSGWNVKNVSNHQSYDYGVEDRIISPEWN